MEAASKPRPVPWVRLIVILGLALRAYHYLREPSVWHDEAALLVNVLGKGFAELLGPLFFAEAAPPLFLWIERAAALSFGDGTYALRLIPFLASCAALLLFARVARQLLPPVAVPWAVLLLAFSDRLLWHSCEAKPYALDVLAAVVLMWLFVRLREWPLGRHCVVYAALAPFVIFLCYPGCFLYGGLLVALLPALWRERRAPAFAGYGFLVLAVFVSFGLLVLGPIHAQRHQDMTACWLSQFPNWQRPMKVPFWMLFSTLDVVRYCFEPTGHALGVLAAVGAGVLWRQGQRTVVVLLVLPLGLALAASCIGAYPYGGARVEVYAAPALALLIAASVPPLASWLRERSRFGALVLTGLLLAPLGETLYRVVVLWPRADCAGASAYVLAQRRPDDAIAANHWEYQYYFRGLDPGPQRVQDVSAPNADRLWIVLTGASPTEKADVMRKLSADWQPLSERRFALTHVYLFTRAGHVAGPSEPPRSRP